MNISHKLKDNHVTIHRPKLSNQKGSRGTYASYCVGEWNRHHRWVEEKSGGGVNMEKERSGEGIMEGENSGKDHWNQMHRWNETETYTTQS